MLFHTHQHRSPKYALHQNTGLLAAACLLLVLASRPVSAAWTPVGDGIDYQEFTAAGPNRLFVCRMDRSNLNTALETTVANGTVSGARETVPSQASRYDDTLSWWGQSWGARNKVVCAINGDFFNGTTGVITGGQCHSGWYAKRFTDWGGYSGFGWTVNRVPFIGGCVHHQPQDQTVTHPASGVSQTFDDINVARGSGKMVIYTPQYNSRTPYATTGVEVLVEVVRPTVIIKSPNKTVGYVRAVYQNSGQHYIPFDHVVISADGSKGQTLLNNSIIGSEIWISQFAKDYNEPDTSGDNGCMTATGLDWQKAFAAIGINYRFLENGQVRPPDPAHSGYAGLIVRNPRTAIAYNLSHIFFIVCDGRSAQSVGMTMTEIGAFCVNVLGATEGVNLDGGGSSTMVVNGTVKNVPSDGSLRAVANGVLMVNILPKQQTTTFTTGQTVRTTNSVNLRLGPGTNYTSMTVLSANTQGTIVSHSLNGVRAKGYNWWKAQFGSTTGWVAESLIATAAPSITQHPIPQVVCPGAATTFSVTASGSTPIGYQWQKNGASITDAGHYSGATTATLTVTNVDSNDAASYRCIVSNSYGSATSNAATLSLNQTPPSAVGVTDEGAWTPSVTTLRASWTPSTPACGSVDHYDYAVGTSATTQDVRDWTSADAATSTAISGLALAEGVTYYVQVRAVDTAGNASVPASSDGITVAPEIASIGSAWALPDSVGLSLRDKPVTAVDAPAFWIEEQDRSAAMKVVSTRSIQAGARVSVAGVLGLSGTQRVMFADVVEILGAGATPAPLGVPQSALGGRALNPLTPGITCGMSAYNVGMLVKCWGSVTYSDSTNPLDRFFYIDDGSGLSDASGRTGVKVRCGSIAPPASGIVYAIGIVTTEQTAAGVVPVVLVTEPAALRALAP